MKKENACLKIPNCVLLCDVMNRKTCCTIQDYVYTIQVSCGTLSKRCNKKKKNIIIWAKEREKRDITSGITQSESILR